MTAAHLDEAINQALIDMERETPPLPGQPELPPLIPDLSSENPLVEKIRQRQDSFAAALAAAFRALEP